MHPAAIAAPSVVSLLVLLLACFNFINTSIAYSMQRVREIGIRKVMGGFRRHLIQQFIGENIVLCVLALVLAVALSEIFVPAYDSLWPELSLEMDYAGNPGLIAFLIGLLFLTAVGAGAYPAFYISSYRPINILTGTQKFGGRNPLIRLLLTLQLAIAMTAIASSVILSQNGKYIDEFDIGFEKNDILKAELEGEESFTLMKSALDNHPDIISMAGTRHLMNQFFSRVSIDYKGVKTHAHMFDIGDNFIETLDFDLIAGRTFDNQYATDADNAIIVSEAFAERFGWESPVGQSFSFEESDSAKEYQVIGVVKNFYPNSVESKVLPTVFRMALPERYEFLMIKSHPQKHAEVAGHVKATWKKLFPNLPYSGNWFEENFADVRHVNNSIRLVCMYIAGMVLIISAMGIYALVCLNIIKRTKEFGIRKALGASMANISSLISRGLILPIVIGGVFAALMGYFLTDMLLSSIWSYYADFGVLPFIFAPLVVVFITILTIGFRVIKTAKANPIEALRYE